MTHAQKGRTLPDAIHDEIVTRIATGAWPSDFRLPVEHELA